MQELKIIIMSNSKKTIDITATNNLVTACEGSIKVPVSDINKRDKVINIMYGTFRKIGYEPVNIIIKQLSEVK